MNKSADEIRQQLIGFACHYPQELITARAKDVTVVPRTRLAVPVVRSAAPITERFIGFTADERCDVRLRDLEETVVATALAQHGAGVGVVTWLGSGFHGHLEVSEPTGRNVGRRRPAAPVLSTAAGPRWGAALELFERLTRS